MRRPVAALAVAALALSGCVVTRETFRAKEAEAARYKADWEVELARAREIRAQFAALRGEVDAVQAEARGLQEKLLLEEANLVAKQADVNALRAENARQAALVEELSRSKRRLEAAKAELERRSGDYEQLAASLRTEIDAGRVELSELKGRLTVQMKDMVLFASGSATLGPDGLAALAKVATTLREARGKLIRVEGHTDAVPVTGGQWGSNWELSTARALAVVRALQDRGVDPTRLAAVGFGEYQPISGNETPEGRSLNRRIEIVLAPAP